MTVEKPPPHLALNNKAGPEGDSATARLGNGRQTRTSPGGTTVEQKVDGREEEERARGVETCSGGKSRTPEWHARGLSNETSALAGRAVSPEEGGEALLHKIMRWPRPRKWLVQPRNCATQLAAPMWIKTSPPARVEFGLRPDLVVPTTPLLPCWKPHVCSSQLSWTYMPSDVWPI